MEGSRLPSIGIGGVTQNHSKTNPKTQLKLWFSSQIRIKPTANRKKIQNCHNTTFQYFLRQSAWQTMILRVTSIFDLRLFLSQFAERNLKLKAD